MSLPSDFDNEINVLRREYERSKPADPLQFAANHFLRRLEAQRAEHLLASTHSSQTSGGPAMAQSTFPGTNPFVSSDRGMQRIGEEDEHDHPPGSPKADPAIAPASSDTTADTASGQDSSFGSFGAFNFGGNSGDSGNRMAPLAGSNLPNDYNFNRRTSVSAESMNPADNESENWTPPSHPKTEEQMKRLREAVARNFIFSHLDEDQTSQVLGALVEKQIPAKNMRIISQGDSGDYFYIVERGIFDIHVSETGKVEAGPDGSGKKVNEVGPGGSFGELALMYGIARAATVTSTETSTLWQLDRVTFRRILMNSAFNRRKMYESFLADVPLLKSLNSYERNKIADALNKEEHPPGYTIIKEGDVGENFYLLEAGKANVFKRGTEASVHSYDKGDYFGELALLNNEPRAASVISATDVKLATLSKDGFHRLLGPAVVEQMKKNDPRHKAN